MAEVKPDGNGDPGSDASLIQRIHRIYASLPDGERRAVDLVLEGPGELALWPATELAARAGVSAPTVSRLFRRLGYASYDEARRASRALHAGGSPLYRGNEAARGAHGPAPEAPDDAIGRHRAAELSAIETTFARLDPRKAAAAAHRLATAQRMRVAGFRNGHFVAEYARVLFSQIRTDVQMLTWAGQSPAESLGDLGERDVVLLIDLRRRTAGFLAFAEALKGAGADVVVVADPSARPPAAARWTLSCAVNTPQAFDTACGAFSVVRLLANEAMLHLGPAARRRIEKIEALHETLSDLERPVARFDD